MAGSAGWDEPRRAEGDGKLCCRGSLAEAHQWEKAEIGQEFTLLLPFQAPEIQEQEGEEKVVEGEEEEKKKMTSGASREKMKAAKRQVKLFFASV